MKAWFSWSERIDRKTYIHRMLGIYGLIGLLGAAIALSLNFVSSESDRWLLMKLSTLASIPIVIAWVCANAARLHDIGRTGWHVGWMVMLDLALPCVPDAGLESFFIGLVPIIWLALSDGMTATKDRLIGVL
jgi:uncharacterized membrane protein YhaH (DUF805 family)